VIARIRVVAALTVAFAVVAPNAFAQRAGDRDMEPLRARCIAAIDARLVRVDRLQNAVNGSRHVTSSHKATLTDQLGSTRSGLQQLRDKIRSDTDRATLRSDCNSIATTYRVYVVVTPRTLEVLVADHETDAIAHLTTDAGRIQAAIDKAKAAGKDTAQAQSDLDSMKSKVDDAKPLVSGKADAVIVLTPSGWPGNRATLQSVHDDLRNARADLHDAAQDGRDALQALK
jgi:hypothetical protein